MRERSSARRANRNARRLMRPQAWRLRSGTINCWSRSMRSSSSPGTPTTGRRRSGTPAERAGRTFRPSARRLGRWTDCIAVVGPVATNVYVLADPSSREAIAIDTAMPSPRLDRRRARRARLDAQADRQHPRPLGPHRATTPPSRTQTGADIAVHPPDGDCSNRRPDVPAAVRARAVACRPSSWPRAARCGSARSASAVLHTPGHTPGSVCLLDVDDGRSTAATRCSPAPGAGPTARRIGRRDRRPRSGGWPTSRTASASCPGHGASTTIGRERAWLDLVRREGRLPI